MSSRIGVQNIHPVLKFLMFLWIHAAKKPLKKKRDNSKDGSHKTQHRYAKGYLSIKIGTKGRDVKHKIRFPVKTHYQSRPIGVREALGLVLERISRTGYPLGSNTINYNHFYSTRLEDRKITKLIVLVS